MIFSSDIEFTRGWPSTYVYDPQRFGRLIQLLKSEERYSTLQVSLEKNSHIPEMIKERQIENDKSRFEVVKTFEAQTKVLVIGSISVRALY